MTPPSPTLSSLPDPDEAFESSSSGGAPASPDSSPWRKLLVFSVMMIVGVVAGSFLSDSLGDMGPWTATDWAMLAVGAPVGLMLLIAIHEAGHTVAGSLAGFRLQHVSVGPLKMQRTPRGWKASRSQHGVLSGMSHGVPGPDLQASPTEVVRRARAIRLIGGAAANVLSGLLVLGLAALPVGETVETAALVFGIMSLGMGFVNLLPLRTGSGLITDGARLIPLLRGTPKANRDVALAMVRAEAYGGTRPREWRARWVDRMLTPRDYGMTDGSTRMLAYRHALDAGRTDDAQAHLAEALNLLDRLPKAQHNGLMVEAAYFEAAHRDDAKRARAWLQRTGSSNGSPNGVPVCAAGRAEAATLLAEGQHAEAHDWISKAESALNEHPVAGTAIAERAWLRDLAQRTPTHA